MGKNKDINLSIKIDENDLFFFMLSHVYKKLSSKITLVFSIICLILFPVSFAWNDIFMSIVLFFGAIIYLVVTPLTLLLQSKKQMASNPVFQNPILFKINNVGFYVSKESEWVEFRWENLYKVIETKRSFLFYISRDQSFIIPKRLIEDNQNDKIRDLISTKANKSKNKVQKEQKANKSN
ncbi:MAG: YcxB family protein [Vallitalea sp.]|jgi:hypothetical protein|nr:YcxB family protein [Vallitalea sp.]